MKSYLFSRWNKTEEKNLILRSTMEILYFAFSNPSWLSRVLLPRLPVSGKMASCGMVPPKTGDQGLKFSIAGFADSCCFQPDFLCKTEALGRLNVRNKMLTTSLVLLRGWIQWFVLTSHREGIMVEQTLSPSYYKVPTQHGNMPDTSYWCPT